MLQFRRASHASAPSNATGAGARTSHPGPTPLPTQSTAARSQRRGLKHMLGLMRRSVSMPSVSSSSSTPSRDSTPERPTNSEPSALELERLQQEQDRADEKAVTNELHRYEQLDVRRAELSPEDKQEFADIDEDLILDDTFDLCLFWTVSLCWLRSPWRSHSTSYCSFDY